MDGTTKPEASIRSHDSSSDSEEDVAIRQSQGSHGTESFQLQIQQLMPQLAQKVSQMEVLHPEVLRVTYAFQALQRFGRVFRVDGDFYHKSRKSEKIKTFWSHSWHGSSWKKILTLIAYYNSRVAICFGTSVGFLMALLHLLGFLPGIIRVSAWPWAPFCIWSITLGIVVAALTLALWRPMTQVFLDRICISSDAKLKAQTILSLSGLLKESDEMLILWDPSWTERLWCLFELAAFLKSKGKTNQRLVIKPTVIGVVSIGCFCTFAVMFVAMVVVPIDNVELLVIPMSATSVFAVAVSYPACSMMRAYFRSLDVMERQLLSVSFATTKSACCDMEHVSSSGQPLICGREVVKECVRTWFGSEATFEDTLRSEVLMILKDDLCDKAFTREWTMGVTAPAFWADLDFAASYARIKMWDQATVFLIEGLVFWFLVVPPMGDYMIQACRLYRAQGSTPCREVIRNLFVQFLCVLPIFSGLTFYVLSSYAVYIPISPDGEGSVLLTCPVWFLCMLVQTLCSQLLVKRWRSRGRTTPKP